MSKGCKFDGLADAHPLAEIVFNLQINRKRHNKWNKQIKEITDKLILEITKFLYKNELMNVLTLHYFENKIEEIGELYLSYDNSEIDALLHI